jgi:Ni/Co efflux regulator RcnB
MRKLLISLLLVSAAASPALADPGDKADRQAARAERQQAKEAAHDSARSERSERSVQVDRPRFTGSPNGAGPQQFVQPQHLQPNPGGGRGDVQAMRTERLANPDSPDSVRNWRGERRQQVVDQREQVMQDRGDRRDNESLRHLDRPVPNVMRSRVPVVSSVPRPWTQPPQRVDNRRRDEVRWSTNWRRDNRYDWRNWRDRNRNRFRIGLYYDPFGWGYQSFNIGWRLWPNYYSSNYWINDPGQYRLPYAPPGTQWIRYYNDALLVDMYTGEVVDVIHGFFW